MIAKSVLTAAGETIVVDPQPDTADDSVLRSTLAQDLANGGTEALGRLCAEHGAPTAQVIWNPAPPDLSHPVLKRFNAACTEAMPTGYKHLTPEALDRINTSSFSDWYMLVETVDDGRDFRYLAYGPEIAATFGRDMTGHLTSDIGGYVSTFFTALYQAILYRGMPVLSLHTPPRGVFARQWRRLMVPIRRPDGSIDRIAACNFADNELRPGLEAVPDPVLVADAEGRILFANHAARSLFGHSGAATQNPSGRGMLLSDYCGFEIELVGSPDIEPQQAVSTETKAVSVQGSLIVHFTVTKRRLYHRDDLCFVVVAKPS